MAVAAGLEAPAVRAQPQQAGAMKLAAVVLPACGGVRRSAGAGAVAVAGRAGRACINRNRAGRSGARGGCGEGNSYAPHISSRGNCCSSLLVIIKYSDQ